MSVQSELEIELLLVLDADEALASLGGSADLGTDLGVVLCLRSRPLGIWREANGQFAFRDLSNYQPLLVAASTAEAAELSLGLLRQCQNGWAERFGDVLKVVRAA